MQKYPRGSRGSPAKGVVWENRSTSSNLVFCAKKGRPCGRPFLALSTRENSCIRTSSREPQRECEKGWVCLFFLCGEALRAAQYVVFCMGNICRPCGRPFLVLSTRENSCIRTKDTRGLAIPSRRSLRASRRENVRKEGCAYFFSAVKLCAQRSMSSSAWVIFVVLMGVLFWRCRLVRTRVYARRTLAGSLFCRLLLTCEKAFSAVTE